MENRAIKILAIDDNNDNLVTLKALLKDAFPDAVVFTELSGRRGIETATAENPDVILLDILMPDMDGFEVCKELKANKILSEIPVVFVTAIRGDKENRLHALEVGADAFLAKPIDAIELTVQIRAMVKIKSANVDKRTENERLRELVEVRTESLQNELKERAKAEEALMESENRFRALFEKGPIGVAYHQIIYNDLGNAIDYRFLDANRSYIELTGVDPRGKLATQAFPGIENDPFDWIGTFGRVASTGEQIRFERYLQANNRWYDCVAYRFKPDHFVAAFMEITVRKQAELLLSEKNEELQHINNELYFAKELAERNETNLTDVLVRFDESQAIAKIGTWEFELESEKVWWSNELYEIFEVDKEVFIPSFTANAKFVHPDDLELYNTVFSELIETGKPLDYTIRIITSSGKLKYCRSLVHGHFDENNKAINLLGTLSDITDQIEIENELVKAKEHAEESDRLKTAFLQNMSHEIRTPMNAIMGFSDLLVDNFDNKAKLKMFAEIIKQRSSDLLDVINDILDIAIIESGQLPVNLDKCNLNGLFDELTSFFKEQQKQIGKQQIKLSLQAPSNLSENLIVTDRVKLKQIFINLIGNALKYTNSGTIEFGCNIESDQFLFFVSDTGIGIPLDKQKMIFERFAQVSPDKNKIVSGVGLGLAIVKGLVKLLNGELFLQSELGKGSTFSFSLPYNTVQALQNQPIIAEATATYHFKNKTILIVEDDQFNAEYLKEILNGTEASILHTIYGIEAVEIALSQSIDLVLMDIRLPDINGYEATRQITKQKPHLKIIAQTAYASYEERQKAIDAGCSDYISKPSKRDDLLSLINKQLTKMQ